MNHPAQYAVRKSRYMALVYGKSPPQPSFKNVFVSFAKLLNIWDE
jgi:hypothetical protein